MHRMNITRKLSLCAAAALVAAPLTLSATSASAAASDVSLDDIRISTSSNRATSVPAQGANITPGAPVYLWVKAPSDVASMVFTNGSATHREGKAPWDLAGGAVSSANASYFSAGSHTVSVKVTDRSGRSVTRKVTFTAGSAAPTPAPQPTTPVTSPTLQYSTSANRSGGQPLSGANLTSGKAYIFLDESDVSQVVFSLNGKWVKTENKAPWDYAGGPSYAANPASLPSGTHTITAKVKNRAGAWSTRTAKFTVGGVSEPTPTPTPTPTSAPVSNYLRVSTNASRSGSTALAGATLSSGNAYIFTNMPSTAQALFYLNGNLVKTENKAPWDYAGGATNSANPAGLPAGTHTVVAKLKNTSGAWSTHTAKFTVKSSGTAPKPAPAPTPTPAPEPTTKPVPVTGKPSASNTGVSKGVSLKKSGSITVTKSGTVLQNLDIGGTITVKANNVTIRNVRIRTNTSGCGINVINGFYGTLVERADIQMGVNGNFGLAGVCGVGDLAGKGGKKHGDNVTVRYSKITGHADGIKAVDYSLYERNYIKVWRPAGSKAHTDGIQGSGRSYFTIRHNTIGESYVSGDNAAIFIQAFTGKRENHLYGIRIYNNWLNGGGYTFHSEDGKKSSGYFHDFKVYNNWFTRKYKYGAVHADGPISGGFGVWADTGKPVPTGSLR